MALDLRTKASIRRHLRVPAAGIGTQGMTLGIRAIIQPVSQLEAYMHALQLEEESIILGEPYGALLVSYGNQLGDVLTVTVNTTTITYTVSSTDMSQQLPYQSIASNIALKLNTSFAPGILSASGAIANPLVPLSALPPVGQISMLAKNGLTFSLTCSGPCITVLANGNNYPTPAYTVDDGGGNPSLAQIAYGLLPVCDALESQLLNESQNLSFSSAGSSALGQAVFRADALRVRSAILEKYRRDLGIMLNFYTSPTVYYARSVRV